MKIQEVCSILEDFAPLAYQAPYDNSGLCVGDPNADFRAVLICFDVTEEVIDEAIAKNCNLIVSHHPLIFSGLKKLIGKGREERCVIKAIRHDIALYACHTNMDSVWRGVNGKLCEQLGLKAHRILSSAPDAKQKALSTDAQNADGEVGLGMLGEYPKAMTEHDFLALIKERLSCRMIRHSALLGKTIRRVAVCGGSGSEFINTAESLGADAYLTADVKYHEFQACENRLLLIDAGHYETEQFIKETFFDILSKKIPTFAVHISELGKNPVNYI